MSKFQKETNHIIEFTIDEINIIMAALEVVACHREYDAEPDFINLSALVDRLDKEVQ